MVLNEDAVPKIYWEPGAPRLNRQNLGERTQRWRRNCRRHPLQPRTGSKREDTVMGFSAKQVQALRRNLDHRHVRTREANGRELSLHRRLVRDLGSQPDLRLRWLEPGDP